MYAFKYDKVKYELICRNVGKTLDTWLKPYQGSVTALVCRSSEVLRVLARMMKWKLNISVVVFIFFFFFSFSVAFVAAYGTSLLVCVLPIIVMEFSVGQLVGRAPVEALYNICPLFKGKSFFLLLTIYFFSIDCLLFLFPVSEHTTVAHIFHDLIE